MKSRLTTLVVLCVVGMLATTASADVLWDQPWDPGWGMGWYNTVSGGPPFGSTWYSVNDVNVATAWTIDSITIYYSALDFFWGDGISQGHLHVWPKVGPLPIEDPSLSPIVPMSAVMVDGTHYEVTASGLALNLAAGEYWINITPEAPSSPFGSEVMIPTLAGWEYGDVTPSYDLYAFPGPPAWMIFNAADGAILIEGTTGGTPVEETTWGSVKAMFR